MIQLTAREWTFYTIFLHHKKVFSRKCILGEILSGFPLLVTA